jgi:sigma-B regulation protein RsbU (phosphoserine phosphatase)
MSAPPPPSSTLSATQGARRVATRPPPSAPSITSFLTDGSLAALCDELSEMTGVRVSLLDPEGRRIVHDRSDSAKPWRMEDVAAIAPPLAPAGSAHDGAHVVELDDRTLVTMWVEGSIIGALLIQGAIDGGEGRSDSRASLRVLAPLLATVAADFCRHELDLRHRVQEVQTLYRLSSMLTRATTMESILQTCLDSAIDVLELDAGSIVLFEGDDGPSTQTEVDLVLKASKNLSKDWLNNPIPLSKERLFDRVALKGELVISEDLFTDDRVMLEKEVREEGLRAAIHAGLVFQDRSIGVIRLYDRRPRTFNESERRLVKSIAHQAAVAVEQARLLKLQEREGRIERQLQLAADVQRRMLPRTLPNIPRLSLAARYVPSFELGGDFYDFIELPGNLGIAIGDVVGKGVAAALLMASVRASLRAHVQDVYHIDDVLSRVNAALCRDTRDNEFATLWYGVIDPQTLRMTYSGAGHDPPLVFRVTRHRPPTPADIDELSIGGMAVGIDPSQRYQRGTYDLHASDVLVLYTDGVTDVQDFNGKRFGRARLRQAVLDFLAQDRDASAGKIVDHIFWSLRQYGGLRERPDDQTVVVLRVT